MALFHTQTRRKRNLFFPGAASNKILTTLDLEDFCWIIRNLVNTYGENKYRVVWHIRILNVWCWDRIISCSKETLCSSNFQVSFYNRATGYLLRNFIFTTCCACGDEQLCKTTTWVDISLNLGKKASKSKTLSQHDHNSVVLDGKPLIKWWTINPY